MTERELRKLGEDFIADLNREFADFKRASIYLDGLSTSGIFYARIIIKPIGDFLELGTKDNLADENIIVGKMTWGNGYIYAVHHGELTGVYIWKIRSRGPLKGVSYKKYIHRGEYTPLKEPFRLESIENRYHKVVHLEKWFNDYLTSHIECIWSSKEQVFVIALKVDQLFPDPGSDMEPVAFCPTCGAELDSFGHCPNCYEEMECPICCEIMEDGECPNCGPTDGQDNPDGMLCPDCGSELEENEEGGMSCPNCGWPITDDMLCPECGAELEGEICPICGYHPHHDEDNMVCPECGTELEEDEDGDRYCPDCGWSVSGDPRCPECNTKLKTGRGDILYCPECHWNDD